MRPSRSPSSKPNSAARLTRNRSLPSTPHQHLQFCATTTSTTFAVCKRYLIFSIDTPIPSKLPNDNEKPWRPKRPSTTNPQQSPATSKSPTPSPQKSSNVSKTRASYLSPSPLQSPNQLTPISPAPPRNLHQPLPPRLPHELHLSPLLALLLHPHNNNDHQPLLEKNP